MEELKRDLNLVGASVKSVDVDPSSVNGIRRLRVLHAKAISEPKPAAKAVSSAGGSEKVTIGKHESTPASQVLLKNIPRSQSIIAAEFEGWFGLSKNATIAIIAGGAVLLILLSYVLYKYISWKPKMVARKGYRAVSKSKGLTVTDSGADGAADVSDSGRPSPLIIANPRR
jgi:hypothetical protein